MDIQFERLKLDWLKLTGDEIRFVNKFIISVFNTYFKMKGFESLESSVSENEKVVINYESRGSGFGFVCHEKGSARNELFLMRYYDFPKIDEDFWATTNTPNPLWCLGFIEKLIYSFDKVIYKAISEQNDIYTALLNESKLANDKFCSRPSEVITGEIIEKIKLNNLSKGFKSNYLSFYRSTKKEIRKDLLKLLSV